MIPIVAAIYPTPFPASFRPGTFGDKERQPQVSEAVQAARFVMIVDDPAARHQPVPVVGDGVPSRGLSRDGPIEGRCPARDRE